MADWLWINGRLQARSEAAISPFDHGVLVGDGVFETLVARGGVPFAALEHWERLVWSCEVMGLMPMSWEDFERAIATVLDANELAEARVRVTQTSGDGPLGSDRGTGRGTVLVTATKLGMWGPTERVLVAPWTRNENGALAGVKSVSYAENVRALAYAKARGCGEALLANTRGELCEGTGSNVFVVRQGRLTTPPLASGCLAGVTRLLVLRACERAGIECGEEPMPMELLRECEEAFLTSSTREVHPISEVDGRALETGPVTKAVAEAFANLVRSRADGAPARQSHP
ncbi:MAG TPA: aminotransferase class IV [Prosthecobacter sp.]|nr:aminotransferase class IV [Prosthecobacter sp.]